MDNGIVTKISLYQRQKVRFKYDIRKGDEFLCKFINPMLAPAMDNRESVFCVSDK